MSTLVCVPILVDGIPEAIEMAGRARDLGADIVEFRIDSFFQDSHIDQAAGSVRRLIVESPLPSIVTCRLEAEGGFYDGPEDARIALYEAICASTSDHGPAYLDIEAAAYLSSQNVRQKVNLCVDHTMQQRDVKTSLILSMHDFSTRPADLFRRLREMQECPAAAVLKVAFRARSVRDALEALNLVSMTDRPTISLAMGEFGLLSRVLAPKYGGYLTFASLESGKSTAPGQPTIENLLEDYRFRSINAATAVYGIIGWPVHHSLSPQLHNAAFKAKSANAVYLPLPVAASDDVQASYQSLRVTVLELLGDARLNFRGASVTMPHKENLFHLATEEGWAMDQVSLHANAANTLVVTNEGVQIQNTDGPAIVACLKAQGVVEGRVVVLGAGGVALGAAAALLAAGFEVTVVARDASKAKQMVEQLRSSGANTARANVGVWERPVESVPHVVINGTPAGMAGGKHECEIPAGATWIDELQESAVVLDTVYTPRITPLLAKAQSSGLRVIDGTEMFLEQAVLQCRAWLGGDAPRAAMLQALNVALEARQQAPKD